MVEKIVNYNIEGHIADSVRKVLAKISDTDFRGKFGLEDKEISDIHIFLDNVDLNEVN